MKKEQFYNITNYIGDIIRDSKFANHVFAVGGSVRDLLMGNDIKDIDLVIDLPDGGVNFASWLEEQGYIGHVVMYPTYGTAMFHLTVFPEEEIECVMTRGEKYVDKDSRNPVCVFDTIEADAIRRDLTINAIYYNVSTREIFDPTGGANDILEKKPVRVTNENPDVVFDDDPLRILRVVRFATRFNLPIDGNTYKSMIKFVDRLDIISKERIQAEFNKIITDKNAVTGIKMLVEIGAMKYIIPEIMETVDMEQNAYHFGTVYEHTLALLEHYHHRMRGEKGKADLITTLACLLHDIGKIKTKSVKDGKIHFYDHEYVGSTMIPDILKRLKYDNDTIKEVAFLVKNHMRTKNFGNNMANIKSKSFNKLAYECGCKERWLRLATVIECDNMSHKIQYVIYGHFNRMFASLPNASKMFGYKLPVTGNDIMEVLSLTPGKIVAEIQNKLLKHAFNNPDIDRETCLKQIKFIYKQIKNEKH